MSTLVTHFFHEGFCTIAVNMYSCGDVSVVLASILHGMSVILQCNCQFYYKMTNALTESSNCYSFEENTLVEASRNCSRRNLFSSTDLCV